MIDVGDTRLSRVRIKFVINRGQDQRRLRHSSATRRRHLTLPTMAVSICSPVRMTASNDTIPLTGKDTCPIGGPATWSTAPSSMEKFLRWGRRRAKSAVLVRCNRRFSPRDQAFAHAALRRSSGGGRDRSVYREAPRTVPAAAPPYRSFEVPSQPPVLQYMIARDGTTYRADA
jgi:hypothetical protein